MGRSMSLPFPPAQWLIYSPKVNDSFAFLRLRYGFGPQNVLHLVEWKWLLGFMSIRT